jgi:hypothetical protein
MVDFVLRLRGALRGVGVAAAGATTVELDASAGTSDTVALACAARGSAGDRRRGAGARAAGSERWDIRVGVRFGVLVRVLFGFLVVNGCSGESGSELLDSGTGKCLRTQSSACMRLLWRRRLDLGGTERATFGYVRHATRRTDGLLGGGSGSGLARGNVEDVELATGGGLDNRVAGWIVRDVVAVNDVVVPVALSLLQGLALESESTLPASSLGGILGERELSLVVVPGAEQMDGLAMGGSAKSEIELDSGHYDCLTLVLCRCKFGFYEILSGQEELISSVWLIFWV